MLKVYVYLKCSTCRNALKWLDENGIAYQALPIRETPPNTNELEKALVLSGGNLRKLFNTSGMDYRALGLKDKLQTLTEAQALTMLSKNGNLVKRPFVITPKIALTGFNAETWAKAFT